MKPSTPQASVRRLVAAYWRGESGGLRLPVDLALAPLEAVFRLGVVLRNRAYDAGSVERWRAPVPVISVGNLTVGGSGKTPMTAWIASRLTAHGRSPAVLLRGYGEDEIQIHRVINPHISVYANRDRSAAVREAVADGADCVVLDDAFQHRRLEREVDIVLIAAEHWNTTRRMLPRGPWREPVTALRRATQVVITRKIASREAASGVAMSIRDAGYLGPIATVFISPTSLTDLWGRGEPLPIGRLAGERVVAVTTLADPRPFLEHLRLAGARTIDHFDFGDHHGFSDAEVLSIAEKLDRRIGVVTLKEAVKLRDRLPATTRVLVLNQQVLVEEGLDDLTIAIQPPSARVP